MENTQSSSTTMTIKKPSQVKEIWRRFKKNKLALAALGFVVVLLLVSACAELIQPYEVCITMNLREKLQTPTAEHIFGTDHYGRDLFGRCLHGARISLSIAFTTSIITMVVGALIGCVAGYYGGVVDELIMRVLDVFSAIPDILLAMAIMASLGSSIPNLVIAMLIARVPAMVRITRSSVLSISGQEYIEAAKAGCTGDFRILMKHVLPNAIGPVIVQTTMSVAQTILQTASLSFLGLGISPPTPEWGAIISEAREFLRPAPYMMVFPGVLIILSSLSMNLVGDGLRDALDPRLKT